MFATSICSWFFRRPQRIIVYYHMQYTHTDIQVFGFRIETPKPQSVSAGARRKWPPLPAAFDNSTWESCGCTHGSPGCHMWWMLWQAGFCGGFLLICEEFAKRCKGAIRVGSQLSASWAINSMAAIPIPAIGSKHNQMASWMPSFH